MELKPIEIEVLTILCEFGPHAACNVAALTNRKFPEESAVCHMKRTFSGLLIKGLLYNIGPAHKNMDDCFEITDDGKEALSKSKLAPQDTSEPTDDESTPQQEEHQEISDHISDD